MKTVLHSFNYSQEYLREQVSGVADMQMVAQPGGMRNHPSWTIGHLIFSCQMLGSVIGVSPWLPDDWARRYGPGSTPVADAVVYEPKHDALEMLRATADRITSAVLRLDDAKLDLPFPDGSYIDVFPTIRHALTQVLVGHTAFHVGQVAVWRKAMGLPGFGRSYE